MAIFASDLFNGTGREKLEDCKAQDSKHIFKGNRGPHVARIQEALRKLGFSVTDPPELFDKSTSDAVFKFKGPPRNILQPGQREPDRFVGKRTIAQLDREVAALEGKKTAPLTLGSTNWRFSFFGNKGFTGKGIYSLFIASLDLQDSKAFSIAELFAGGTLLAGFKGEARGTFKTAIKIGVERFQSSRCELNLFKLPGSEFLQGTMKLLLIGDGNLTGFLPILQLKDETFGTTLTTGNISMIGQVRK